MDGKKTKFKFVRPEHQLTITFPRIFSCIDDPVAALSFFDYFRAQLAKRFVKSIHFDHSTCEQLGLAAQAVVDALVREEAQRRGKEGLAIGGTYPKNLELKILLRAIGTLRMIGHPDMLLPKEIESRIERCDQLYGNGKELKASDARDRAGTRIVGYFDRVLRHQKFELTMEAKRNMVSLVTEVIGNAEEHSGRWYAIGYSSPCTQAHEREVDECQIVIFNFGKTIYDTLSASSAATEVKQRIQEIVAEHKKNGYFNDVWDEETLWTLAALQHGVSRYKKGVKGKTRGKGTIEMIRAFSELATEPQKMCVISGAAYILFDGTYDLEVGPTVMPQIAFNQSNDLLRPPEQRFVRRLQKRFPGTIISLRFMLDSEHFQTVEA